jgi:hypothetical protein
MDEGIFPNEPHRVKRQGQRGPISLGVIVIILLLVLIAWIVKLHLLLLDIAANLWKLRLVS